MLAADQVLGLLPAGLRDPLLAEYGKIVQNYFEHRWSPAELSGGLLCEIVYTILDGHAKGTYATAPAKPGNFANACRVLENHAHVPRSFQILLPRLLPALYEIRNNRGVGHVGGDVDPNHMDATVVLGIANWVVAELVRVFHAVTVQEAQDVTDSLVERRVPLVWQVGDLKRVLDTSLSLQEQVLVLLGAASTPTSLETLKSWTDYDDMGYLRRLLRSLHSKRLIEFTESLSTAQLLPPGQLQVESIVSRSRPSVVGASGTRTIKRTPGRKKARRR